MGSPRHRGHCFATSDLIFAEWVGKVFNLQVTVLCKVRVRGRDGSRPMTPSLMQKVKCENDACDHNSMVLPLSV